MSNDDNKMEIEIEETNNNDQNKTEINPIPKGGMPIYYEFYFPYQYFFEWLGKGNVDYFQRREFSFTLPNDIYCRFQSFTTTEDLKKKLIRDCPKKIDIGAVYNVLPTLHKTADLFNPEEKEIVFDIDMTDYDDIRTCCHDAKICNKCWKYMIVAYKILDQILKIDFGYKHILYAFSGRRGIHCWLCDNEARKLKDDGRSALANYIKFKMANINMDVTQGLFEPINPSLKRSIEIIKEYFPIVLKEQDLFKEEKVKKLIKGLIKSHFHTIINRQNSSFDINKIDAILNTDKPSEIKYDEINNYLYQQETILKLKSNNKYTKTQLCLYDFMLNILYPRLDINVSTHINHLLKSPFCIHPKTGLVSVPLSPDDIINFSIEKIPNIKNLVEDHMNGKINSVFEKYKKIFEDFTKSLNNK